MRRAATRGIRDLRAMATRVGGRTGDGSGAPSVARSPAGGAVAPRPGARTCRRPRRGRMRPMTDQEARYDRSPRRYAELLVAGPPAVDAGAPRRGRARRRRPARGGSSTSAAARARWRPRRSAAGRRSRSTASTCPPACSGSPSARAPALPPSDRGRVRFRQAPADRLPYPDGSFDLALTSFVLQLVPSRHRALREIRRVLARDGRVALVTWLQGGAPLDGGPRLRRGAAGRGPRAAGAGRRQRRPAADRRRRSPRCGAPGSRTRRRTPRSSTTSSRRSRSSRSSPGSTTRTSSTSFEPDERAALEADVLARLRALPADGLRLVAPIVYASGRRT